ncbi:MAG TPA: SPW repeat protein [Burkholderiales bacterium]
MNATKGPLARWQDWAIFALALWLAVSPWLLDYAWHAGATANAALAGLALALAAHFEASCELAVDWLNLGAGLWLLAAPFLLGFDAVALATATSLSVGAAVTALAASALRFLR